MTGNALRRAQAFLGYTQAQMAARMGLSLATYQRRLRLADEAIPVAEESHVMRLVEDRSVEVLWINPDMEGVE